MGCIVLPLSPAWEKTITIILFSFAGTRHQASPASQLRSSQWEKKKLRCVFSSKNKCLVLTRGNASLLIVRRSSKSSVIRMFVTVWQRRPISDATLAQIFCPQDLGEKPFFYKLSQIVTFVTHLCYLLFLVLTITGVTISMILDLRVRLNL
jgi:hypothetical protein